MIECGPNVRAEVASVATPEFRTPGPRAVIPSKKVTVPAGVPDERLVTSAVNVTVCPRTAGLLSAVKVVVVPGRITVNTSAEICPMSCCSKPVEFAFCPSVAYA